MKNKDKRQLVEGMEELSKKMKENWKKKQDQFKKKSYRSKFGENYPQIN